MDDPRYIVQEDTLGYVSARGSFCPLARGIDGHDPKNGPTYLDGTARAATPSDFVRYRLQSPPNWKAAP